MASNAQKLPFATSLSRFADQKVLDGIQLLGKALPCSVVSVSGSIVTVNFELNAAPFTLPQVTCPIFGPQWIRYPTQVGDLGVVFPADVRIGGVSGLASEGFVADLTTPANLSALVFFPIGNARWTTTDDPDAVVIYGPNGVILRDEAGTTTAVINPTGMSVTIGTTIFTINGTEITMTAGGQTFSVSASGINLNGKNFLTHEHTEVMSGGDQTGPVA